MYNMFSYIFILICIRMFTFQSLNVFYVKQEDKISVNCFDSWSKYINIGAELTSYYNVYTLYEKNIICNISMQSGLMHICASMFVKEQDICKHPMLSLS